MNSDERFILSRIADGSHGVASEILDAIYDDTLSEDQVIVLYQTISAGGGNAFTPLYAHLLLNLILRHPNCPPWIRTYELLSED